MKEQKLALSLFVLFAILFGFLIGRISSPQKALNPSLSSKISPEVSIVKFLKLSGDQIFLDVSGPVRILWGDENFLEKEGEFPLPLSQIPNENDLGFFEFPYTGNTKTKKFYNSNSYAARGTEIRYRRFFRTKQEALDAGFVPVKNLK